MRNKWLPSLILVSTLLVCLPAAGDTLDKKLSIPGVVNEKWAKNYEGYGRRAPVTNVGDWILFAVDTTSQGQPTLLVRRITLMGMKTGEHTIKVEDCYLTQPDKNIVQDLKVKPYEFPLGWEYPIRAAQQKTNETSLSVAGKNLKVRSERIFYKDASENYYHEIYYWDEKLPFGAPVKRIRTGPFEKSGEPKANTVLKTHIFRVLGAGTAADRGPFEPKRYLPPEPLPFKFEAKPNDWIAAAKYSGTLAEPLLNEIVFITYEGVKQNVHSFKIEMENKPSFSMSVEKPEEFFSIFFFGNRPTWTIELGQDKIKPFYAQKIDAAKYLLSGAGVMFDIWVDNNISFGTPAVVEFHAGHRAKINEANNLMLLAHSQKSGQEKPKVITLREQWMKTFPIKENKESNTPKAGIK